MTTLPYMQITAKKDDGTKSRCAVWLSAISLLLVLAGALLFSQYATRGVQFDSDNLFIWSLPAAIGVLGFVCLGIIRKSATLSFVGLLFALFAFLAAALYPTTLTRVLVTIAAVLLLLILANRVCRVQ